MDFISDLHFGTTMDNETLQKYCDKISKTNADVVIYAGTLVNPELLEYFKQGCEIHYSAFMNLQEIIDVMEKGVKEEK